MNTDDRILELEKQIAKVEQRMEAVCQKEDGADSYSAEWGRLKACFAECIAGHVQVQRELEQEREKLKAVVKMSGDMMFEYDIEADKMVYTNTGDDVLFSREIARNYSDNLYELVMEEDEEAGKVLVDALHGGREYFNTELRRIGTDNKYHWVSVAGKAIYNKEGKAERILGRIRNIDEQKRKEKELQDKSQKDSLTGLYNHMTAKNMMTEKVAGLDAGKLAYLIVCDVDDFKKLNDMNGHMFGDAVLCSFADALCKFFPQGIKGRIGGDEFLVYVDNIKREELEEKLYDLNVFLADRYDDDSVDMHISCSLGVVEIDGTIRDFDILFQWADNILYMIKSQGKGAHMITRAEVGKDLPKNTYLDSEKNKDLGDRKESLITTEKELVLFCVELLENVPNAKIALKMICERTCSFFDLDDMVCIEHADDGKKIIYQWNMHNEKEYAWRILEPGVFEWDKLYGRADEQGVLLYNAEKTAQINTEEATSVMIAFSKEARDYRGSIVFVDRRKDRDWSREQETLARIANHIFIHLRFLKLGERERMEIDRKLNYDVLTGLPVYNRFVTTVEEFLDGTERNNLYCVYSDFSNFQYFNEVYGYEAGDKILREFADYLRNDYERGIAFCRVTSDHFLGLIWGDGLEDARQHYLDFVWEFSESVNKRYEQCNLVIACGLYEVKPEDTNVAIMMDNANEARKKCKEQKVITAVVAYTEEIKAQTENIRTIEANIMTAYNNKEFCAFLQPKISLDTGKIIGAEALARWIKPDGSMVMPGQFIEISEKNGFITKIDFEVFDCVMEYLQEALAIGEMVVPISVNFSRRHNEFKEFVPSVLKRLKTYDVPGHLVEAELTESVFASDLNRLKDNIEQLRNNGIEVSVDDFGSGYSSLNLLSKVSVDTIKLDKQFLDSTLSGTQEETALTIIKYLIKMLKHLGFKVLAEGVETAEQLDMLKKAECDMVQGYYYAKPMPIAEFRQFLKKFNGEKT